MPHRMATNSKVRQIIIKLHCEGKSMQQIATNLDMPKYSKIEFWLKSVKTCNVLHLEL